MLDFHLKILMTDSSDGEKHSSGICMSVIASLKPCIVLYTCVKEYIT